MGQTYVESPLYVLKALMTYSGYERVSQRTKV